MSVPRNISGTVFSFSSFRLLLWYQLLQLLHCFFAFLLCVAFTTSHMFLVNASVNFFLMPSSYGFHVAAHRLVPVLFYLLLATIPSFPYFYSPSTPLPAVSKGILYSFFLCRPHSPWVFMVQDIVYNQSANYICLNIIHRMRNFCRKDG